MMPDIEVLRTVLEQHAEWRGRWEEYADDETLAVDPQAMRDALTSLMQRLNDSYPFFHPDYAGQMLKPPHPVAVAGYLAAMLINPNNHALDGGPSTGYLEKEVVADLARMFGYGQFLGHLASSGTFANLEALWVSRELFPDRAVAYSEHSHYTHSRMCATLGIRGVEVPATADGKMDVQALRALCLSEDIGTVVATVGTTGFGALDPLPEILALGEEFRFRVHADAAYGGFYRLLADGPEAAVHGNIYAAVAACDSIVIDPHKHGLQPYGCGCVLFRDPSVGRFYKHDSPYTYFTSTDLHLGEISLECSRAGASAAALWVTLRCLPLHADDGLGSVLRRCRNAALAWADLLRTSTHLYLVTEPELDIVVFFCGTASSRASSISALSDAIFTSAMHDPRARVYLSKLRVKTALLAARYPGIVTDTEWTVVLRSALMKPEHERHVPELHRRIEQHASLAMASSPDAAP